MFIAQIMRQCQVNWSNGKFDAVDSMSYIAFYLFIITIGKTLHMTIRHLASNNCNLDKAFQWQCFYPHEQSNGATQFDRQHLPVIVADYSWSKYYLISEEMIRNI